MGKNSTAFVLEIDRDLELAEDELRMVVRSLALQGLQRLVLRTPVDEGRARGNWIVSIAARDASQKQVTDKSGDATIAEGAATISTYDNHPGFPSIFIQNNLPYIQRLEDGSSTQAPNGMLGITFAELKAQT